MRKLLFAIIFIGIGMILGPWLVQPLAWLGDHIFLTIVGALLLGWRLARPGGEVLAMIRRFFDWCRMRLAQLDRLSPYRGRVIPYVPGPIHNSAFQMPGSSAAAQQTVAGREPVTSQAPALSDAPTAPVSLTAHSHIFDHPGAMRRQKGIRVNQLAKELGYQSKEILDRCNVEGLAIPDHMTVLSAGLEATLRELFPKQEGRGVATAVEAEARALRRKKKEPGEAEAVVEVPAAPEPAAPVDGEPPSQEQHRGPPTAPALAVSEPPRATGVAPVPPLGISAVGPEIRNADPRATEAGTALEARGPATHDTIRECVIVDGLNVMLAGNSPKPRMAILLAIVVELLRAERDVLCIFDANTRYKLCPICRQEKADKFKFRGGRGHLEHPPDADVMLYDELCRDCPNHFIEVPGKCRADDLILLEARDRKAIVISGDQFRSYEEDFPWVTVPGRILPPVVSRDNVRVGDRKISCQADARTLANEIRKLTAGLDHDATAM